MKKQNIYSVSIFIFLVVIFSVQKQTGSKGKNIKMHASPSVINGSRSVQANTYSSEVAFKWIDMQLELMRTSSPFIGGLPPSRPFAYTGIALYEAVVPGMPAYQTLSGQLTDMPVMPKDCFGSCLSLACLRQCSISCHEPQFFSQHF